MDVFDLVAKLTLDTSGYENSLNEAENHALTFGGVLGGALEGAAKLGAAGLAAAGTAAVGLSKSAVSSYADYEQLVGGVETLYGNSYATIDEYAESVGKTAGEVTHAWEEMQARQSKILENADKAYMTSGMSANDYMETVTGFAAALNNSLGEYAWQSASYADMAVGDMADNSNKMGTDMEDIQNAYAGFAKGNFMMLDNLKLGYGGTKEEMERLLRTAEEIEGYDLGALDISSFADISEAIHIIQNDMGITGTTAKEASTTITGSTLSAKAAWENLLTSLADGNRDIGPQVENLVHTGQTMLDNVIPVFETALSGLGDFVTQMAPVIVDRLPGMIGEVVPALAESAWNIVTSFATAVADNGPALIDQGLEMLTRLSEGAVNGIPELLGQVLPMIMQWTGEVRAHAGEIVDSGIDILLNFLQGIINALPELITYVPTIISNIAGIINDNGPKILAAGIELLGMLLTGIIEATPTLIAEFPKIVKAIFDVITATNWLQLGSNVITWISNGVKNLSNTIPTMLKDIGKKALDWMRLLNWKGLGTSVITFIKNGILSLVTAIPDGLLSIGRSAVNAVRNIDWLGVGIAIVSGIANGITGSAGAIVDAAWNAAYSALRAAKNFLGIHSPSTVFRDQVGKMMALGMGEGFEDGIPTEDMVRGAETALDAVSKVQAPILNPNGKGTELGEIRGNRGTSGVTINVYARADQNEKQVAKEVQRRLTDEERRREAATT